MAYVFSDTTGVDDGVIQECEAICLLDDAGISGNTSQLKKFTRRLNQAKDRFFALAFKYDSLWNFDDRRYADGEQKLPIATTNIVSGTGSWLFDDELLGISQVFFTDPSGNLYELSPQDDKSTDSVYLTRPSGVPTKYELVGNSIMTDRIPNYSVTDGLKVVFKRNGVKFSYTDGAVDIGIPSLFFRFLANFASYPYLIEHKLPHSVTVKQMIIEDELAIRDFVSNRANPKRVKIMVTQEDNR